MRVIIFLFFIATAVSAGINCDIFKEDSNSNNFVPFIEDIIPDVKVIGTNMQVTLQAIATDQDGDSLSYSWTVSSGEFVEFDKNKAVWQTPDSQKHVEIKCFVNDGRNVDFLEKIFTVEWLYGILKGYIYDKETNSPITGIAVTADGPGGTFYGASSISGYYNIKDIPEGSYLIQVYSYGYLKYTENVNIVKGINEKDIYLEKQ